MHADLVQASIARSDAAHSALVASWRRSLQLHRLDPAERTAPRRLTEGWSLNGITRFASGFPVTIGQSGDRSLTGTSGVDEPDFLGGLVFQDPRNAGPDGAPNRSQSRPAQTPPQPVTRQPATTNAASGDDWRGRVGAG